MAGNIVGEPLRDYVQDQIGLRQEIHGKTKRGIKELSYLNSRTSWIKFASGVSLERSRLDMLGMDKNYPEGVKLATEFILFNGTSKGNLKKVADGWFELETKTGTVKSNRDPGIWDNLNPYGATIVSGVVDKLDGYHAPKAGILGNSPNPAYGMTGNTDFGLVPMPGIIDATVRSLELGSIKKASIKIKAYNKTPELCMAF